MDSSPDSAERPISYSSTSSSASSRDSHCSLGSRSTLVPAPHCNPVTSDRDSGAIRLELVPARQLGCREEDDRSDGRGQGTQGGGQTLTEHSEPEVSPDGGERTGPVQGPRTYVDRVVQEILDTERTYVQDLRSIVEDYLECISNQSRLALSSEDKGSLFGNIQDIYHFNRDLLHDLEKCNADPVAIAECFVSKSEEFHIYTQYCTNYPRSVAVLTECMRNKALAKFFRERQESLRHSLPLGSYLLKPVQRILKYHLLLHEIANHMEKDTETYEVVQEAIDTMQRVAWHINDMKRKHEHAVRLQEIQSLLTNWKGPDLIGYGELVLEGTFRLQRAKNERTLFLFDKLLLITKKREETYTYKAHILCCNLMLVEIIPKEPLSFSVFHYKNPKLQHTVQAKSQQDKRMWILHLKRLILENHPAKIPAKAKQAILEMDAMHHPGFHYSPDGDKKDSPQTKEGPTPRRGRRKEPLSKLLKNAKQNAANTDGEKRISLGATLLSPMSQLALGTIGRSRSLINQSQESLDPGDHYDHSDREEEPHQQDADDEDDSGLGGGKRLRVPGKSSRKRLNPQASVDSIEQWKSFNMNSSDLQKARESLVREGSHHPPLLRTPHVMEEPPDTPVPSVIVTESDHSVRNIWADHRARRAMFPTRQRTMQPDDEDEDIYQMFVPTEPSGPEPEVRSERSEATSSPKTARPRSWHVEQVPSVQVDPPPDGGRVLRRASSAGEKSTEAPQSPDGDQAGNSNLEVIHTESSSNDISGSSSAEQLTIDDIENVYDNISYEDLKRMGLVRRDPEESQLRKETSTDAQGSPSHAAGVLNAPETPVVTEPLIEPDTSSDSNRSSTQEGRPFGTCELKIVEENIYDTICFREPPSTELKGMNEGNKLKTETDSLQAWEQDLTESLGGFLSEESLHFGEDDASHPVPCCSEPDYSSSSASETFSQRSPKGDKMSEQVDEIWNDLENYIKINEKKADRLPAAFPVSASESPKKASSVKSSPTKSPLVISPPASNPTSSPPTHQPKAPPVTSMQSFTIPVINFPDLHSEGPTAEENLSPAPTSRPLPVPPEPLPGTVKSIRNRLARLSSGSFRLEDDDLVELPPRNTPQRDIPLKDLHSLFPGELAGLDSPLASSSLLLGESVDLDQMEKSKNRVFLMARQYSQKIKKANQLLRMRSMDPGDACSRTRAEKKQKDLAAILEEKKQGGTAIGARIAEYSQLYDQIMFKDPPGPAGPHHSHPGLPSSPSMPETSLEEDWLLSTYSNGELVSFVSSSIELDGARASSTPLRRLTSACSIPSLKTSPPSPTSPPSQRWSSCMSPPSEKEEHVYSSIKRHPSFNALSSPSSKSSPSSHCQSLGSLGSQQQEVQQSGLKCNGPTDRLHGPSLGRAGRQSSLPERSTHGQSDLTLHDGQQVVVLNRASALSILSATQNYMANFKDDGEDDDDYVEIRSEDESEQEQDRLTQRNGSSAVLSNQSRGLVHSQSLPCTPVRSCDPLRSLDREHLEKYLWSEPQQSQPKIVQSLREKFQCLSSSSFA
ncbi:pleckstrin homology domain-containing family G member 1 isoform X2 [Cottoperca gobio]|nr:pleckstrin homology domain-containing family G member 1 isoform X2 [Cottoperca gobio]XP_029281191.1 pleckstrin homology domain-containing family G member 1 isoform X2 [Cottoperca gobio]XP_029281192.1 pleckstrin homology domain-containing family G member 1 isoform X2 [Cottoperca gobio]XP_029281193.1 pleckstrin homology domain-containing family G member 1 isoform X2 [Cottoperca gobio]XP_029281194.1 pleckstrin homology domain-containing family G member 1 isoform X2 [Cottoperca gobio]